MDASTKDPVCGMRVSPNTFSVEHLGGHYNFCSQQCLDRFKANPHLYIGVPGEAAPKQKGMEVIKRQRFRLEQAEKDPALIYRATAVWRRAPASTSQH